MIPNCNAMQRFETVQNTTFRCLANKKAKGNFHVSKWSDIKCFSPLYNVDRQSIRRSLVKLERMNIYTDGEECITMVEELARQAICHHQKELAQTLFKDRVRELLRQVQEQEAAHEPIAVASNSIPGISWWLRRPPEGAMHYLPKYRSYRDAGSVPEEVTQSVRYQAGQPLITETHKGDDGLTKHNELRDGYLYVYWNRASFRHLKIGFTGIDVDERLRDWEEQCLHVAEKRYQSPKKIKHAARVEKLIHTEFASQRVCEPACRGCGKMHIEWFQDLDLQFVIRRIEAWSEWINKSPYEFRKGAWGLKEDPEFGLPLPSAMKTEEPQTPKKPRSPRSISASPRKNSRPQRAREHSPSPQLESQLSSLLTLFAALAEPAASAVNAAHTMSAPILK